MSEKKRQYIPPRIADLSGISVRGQTQGRCAGGSFPYYDCVQGTVYQAVCNPGTGVDTSQCAVGGVHAYPACDPGSFATTACLGPGSAQNF
jgi:hypothetical protein